MDYMEVKKLPPWFSDELSLELLRSDHIMEQTPRIVTDIVNKRLGFISIVEHLGAVLTHHDATVREKGMIFYSRILKNMPKDFLSGPELQFVAQFYTDRLQDHHRMVSPVLEGYLATMDMKNYEIKYIGKLFTILFREVSCQTQTRADRYQYYQILQNALEIDVEYLKSLGPAFVQGVIQAIDGERDPRNLLYLYNFLAKFIREVPLHNLVEEMFEIISCYFPIDFHPSPEFGNAITRADLAMALCPCLCAIPEFGERCLFLLVDKLDSVLHVAKLDSLRLLKESCKTFKPECYDPFLKTLWASIHREILSKGDDELKLVAYEALSALVAKVASREVADDTLECFIKGILISTQSALVECTTVNQFVETTKILLTTANASKASAWIVVRAMIPCTITLYGFKSSSKLKIASLGFICDLYGVAKHWGVADESFIAQQIKEVPSHCLTVVSDTDIEFQKAGFKTLTTVIDALSGDLVLPFLEILLLNIQFSTDEDLFKVNNDALTAIAGRFPEQIQELVVNGRFKELSDSRITLAKQLYVLCKLAYVDELRKVIMDKILKLIVDGSDVAFKVISALNFCINDTNLFTDEKIIEIEQEFGLIDIIIVWLCKELTVENVELMSPAYSLVSNIIGALPAHMQKRIIDKEVVTIGDAENNVVSIPLLACLYASLRRSVHDEDFDNMLMVGLQGAMCCEDEFLKKTCGAMVGRFLNKVEDAEQYKTLTDTMQSYMAYCENMEDQISASYVKLYGWIVKGLVMRGDELFSVGFHWVVGGLTSPAVCSTSSAVIHMIVADSAEMTARHHCRRALLYRQRLFQEFWMLSREIGPLTPRCREHYLLSWVAIFDKVPKACLTDPTKRIAPLVVESLSLPPPQGAAAGRSPWLPPSLRALSHVVRAAPHALLPALGGLLRALLHLAATNSDMEVRIKSLEVIHDVAVHFGTVTLLPYKVDTLLRLAVCLDDGKRLVRQEAVRARTRWCLIGAPGEDKDN